MERDVFIKRLVELRMRRNVSARDMSLSLGQSPGYINNIENGVNYPSMTVFFYICDYLGVTPQEFFDLDSTDPARTNDLLRASKGLQHDQIDTLITLAKGLQK